MIGASFGVATFGSIFTNGLRDNLTRLLPAGGLPSGFDPEQVRGAEELAALPPAVAEGYQRAYMDSLAMVFLWSVPVAVVAFALAWALTEIPLRTTAHASDLGEAYGMPTARSPADELERALGVLAGRQDAKRVYGWLADRADTRVGPGATWLLGWLGRRDRVAEANLPSTRLGPHDRVAVWADDLRRHGYVEGAGFVSLTPAGRAVLDRVAAAREEGLARLLNGWQPELLARLRELAEELVGAKPIPASARKWRARSDSSVEMRPRPAYLAECDHMNGRDPAGRR